MRWAAQSPDKEEEQSGRRLRAVHHGIVVVQCQIILHPQPLTSATTATTAAAAWCPAQPIPSRSPQHIHDMFLKKNSRKFLRDKLYNSKICVKSVMSENLLFLSFSWQLPGRNDNPPEIMVILLTRGLPCVQCTKNHLLCENYTANYNIQEHQLNYRRFPGAISSCRRFPGVVDTLNKQPQDWQQRSASLLPPNE